MWVWIVLLVLVTFVLATLSIGWVTATLSQKPRRSVYDMIEAVEFVAERLPSEATARISYEEVGEVLGLHADYLTQKGLASEKTADDVVEDLVVVADDERVAWILGQLDEGKSDSDDGEALSDSDVVLILDAEHDYYRAIGAIGPRVE